MSQDTDPQPTPTTATDAPIVLQVGERRFTTTLYTLDESTFFQSLLQGHWKNALPDGSYFIDADPDLFEHILRYLRRGVFPLFYDKRTGHDLAMYLAILEEARYFGIDVLRKWLEEEIYYKAVTIRYDISEKNVDVCYAEIETSAADTEYNVSLTTNKVYICPREIPTHMGKSDRCRRKCRNFKGEGPVEYGEEPALRVVRIMKRVMFDMDKCRKPVFQDPGDSASEGF
ncbi:hypothetical protein BO70DRAFT_394338 [Aspergillus heteromorphus CBS 117.55]|uniref:BTB domain-containing protein n=1 Tax=Aspergillus heteromorphus CBS 117.55 TaxID=1448321 RepID=A0A317WR98_9EURO|nr:uncharacterized protein BO70DRAFT_394338 [Aspergillus heteromorphus CBS 117.55]PWY87448.1 hypothetical protein BO70DRAFT_394338 [Aspergillus heteromorphus CBS 117.55]